MLDRLFITVTVLSLLLWALWYLNRWQRAKALSASQHLAVTSSQYTLIYFWSTGCALCRTAQKPALERLIQQSKPDELDLVSYNVDEDMTAASSWGVKTVPTTVLLGQQGEVIAVNNGFTSEQQLMKQMRFENGVI